MGLTVPSLSQRTTLQFLSPWKPADLHCLHPEQRTWAEDFCPLRLHSHGLRAATPLSLRGLCFPQCPVLLHAGPPLHPPRFPASHAPRVMAPAFLCLSQALASSLHRSVTLDHDSRPNPRNNTVRPSPQFPPQSPALCQAFPAPSALSCCPYSPASSREGRGQPPRRDPTASALVCSPAPLLT